jgi:hypothetical protein
MDWFLWILLAAAILLAGTGLLRKGKTKQEFDPAAYSYRPSPAVRDSLEKDDEVGSIRLIRDETGLGLKDGRDLFRYLKSKLTSAEQE